MTDPRVRFTAAAVAARREYECNSLQRSRTARLGGTCSDPSAVIDTPCCNGPSCGHERFQAVRDTDRTAVDHPRNRHEDA